MADVNTESVQPPVAVMPDKALEVFEEGLFTPKKLQTVSLDNTEKDFLVEAIVQSVYESVEPLDHSNADKESQFLGDIFEIACHQFISRHPESLMDVDDSKHHNYIITDVKFVDELREKMIKRDFSAQLKWDIGAPDFLVFEEADPGVFQLVAVVETKFLGARNAALKSPNSEIPTFYQARILDDKKTTQFGKARNFIDYLRYSEENSAIVADLREGVSNSLKEFVVPENVRMIYMIPQDQSISQLTNDSHFREMHLPFTATEFRDTVYEAAGVEEQALPTSL